MLLSAILAVLLAIAVRAYTRRGAAGAAAPNWYMVLSPLPVVLAFVLPTAVGLTWGEGPESKRWIDRATWAGVGLSLALSVVGGVLATLASRRRRHSPLLGFAIVLAAAPVTIVVVTLAALWLLAQRR